jgi:hypothetical protein
VGAIPLAAAAALSSGGEEVNIDHLYYQGIHEGNR